MFTTLRLCDGYPGTPVIQGAQAPQVSPATHPSILYKDHFLSVPQLEKGGESDSKVHNFHTRMIIKKKKDFRLPIKYDKVNTHIHSSSSRNLTEKESTVVVAVVVMVNTQKNKENRRGQENK